MSLHDDDTDGDMYSYAPYSSWPSARGSDSEKLASVKSWLKRCTGNLKGVGIPPLVGLWYMSISIRLYSRYLRLVVIKRGIEKGVFIIIFLALISTQ